MLYKREGIPQLNFDFTFRQLYCFVTLQLNIGLIVYSKLVFGTFVQNTYFLKRLNKIKVSKKYD